MTACPRWLAASSALSLASALAAPAALAATLLAAGCEGNDLSVDVNTADVAGVKTPPVLGGRPDRDAEADPEAGSDPDAGAPDGAPAQSERVGQPVIDATFAQLQLAGGLLFGLSGATGVCNPPTDCTLVSLDFSTPGAQPVPVEPTTPFAAQKGAPLLLATDSWVYLAAADSRLYAIRPSDGSVWAPTLGSAATAMIARPEGVLLFDELCHVSYFQPVTGEIIPAGGQPKGVICFHPQGGVVAGETLFFLGRDSSDQQREGVFSVPLSAGPTTTVALGFDVLPALISDGSAIYWADSPSGSGQATATIHRAAADGSAVSDVATVAGRVTALALAPSCPDEPCLYASVSTQDSDAIVKLPRSGGDPQPVAGPLYAPVQRGITAIAVVGDEVYWSSTGVHKIAR